MTAIKQFSRVALLDDGRTVPIVTLLDGDGDETDDPNEAVVFIAGEGGEWFTGRCDDYAEVAIN